jgi:hypothetical protein
MRSWAAGCAAVLGLGLGAAAREAAAASLEFPLAVVLRDGKAGSFGTVRIEELAGGDLEFRITLAPELGPRADLHELYFNLVDGLDDDDLRVSDASCNGHGCNRPFRVRGSGRLRWGGQARFDFRVDFGKGTGRKGNGMLTEARFVLDADEALALADVLEQSTPTPRGIAAFLAAGAQSARLERRDRMETIAAVPVPEPGTAALMLLGLGGLGVAGRRPRD